MQSSGKYHSYPLTYLLFVENLQLPKPSPNFKNKDKKEKQSTRKINNSLTIPQKFQRLLACFQEP